MYSLDSGLECCANSANCDLFSKPWLGKCNLNLKEGFHDCSDECFFWQGDPMRILWGWLICCSSSCCQTLDSFSFQGFSGCRCLLETGCGKATNCAMKRWGNQNFSFGFPPWLKKSHNVDFFCDQLLSLSPQIKQNKKAGLGAFSLLFSKGMLEPIMGFSES